MIKRYDVTEYDLKVYPQYFTNLLTVPKENGRFVLYEDVKHLIKAADDARELKELREHYDK